MGSMASGSARSEDVMALRVIMDAHGLAILLRRSSSPDGALLAITASDLLTLPRDLTAPIWDDFFAGLRPAARIGIDPAEWSPAVMAALRRRAAPWSLVDMSRQISAQLDDRQE